MGKQGNLDKSEDTSGSKQTASSEVREIEVEKTVHYLDTEKLWSIALWTPEPYGKFYPKTIYVTAIFHKNLDKALKMAWDEFYKRKEWQDADDRFQESTQTEIVKVAV